MKKNSLAILAVFISVSAIEAPQARPQEPIKPIKVVENVNLAQVELGKQLYFDPRLSKSGFISCNSCHNLSMGGTDNLPTSIGHNWHKGPINSPTVLNSSLNLAQFWDGRAKDLQEQAAGPIANPGEMGSTHALAVEVINSIPQYVRSFRRLTGEEVITIDHVTAAIAEFEKTLTTPNSRFDQWLLGDEQAISNYELEGYQLFKNSGCIACHSGSAVGANTFQKMGVVKPYKTTNKAQGLIAVTGKPEDKNKFKVPTLRNIELTYPYFHDGQVNTLSEAVNIMGEVQLGRTFTTEETNKIVAFLKTLTGEQPDFNLPQLPPSSEKTPTPQPFG